MVPPLSFQHPLTHRHCYSRFDVRPGRMELRSRAGWWWKALQERSRTTASREASPQQGAPAAFRPARLVSSRWRCRAADRASESWRQHRRSVAAGATVPVPGSPPIIRSRSSIAFSIDLHVAQGCSDGTMTTSFFCFQIAALRPGRSSHHSMRAIDLRISEPSCRRWIGAEADIDWTNGRPCGRKRPHQRPREINPLVPMVRLGEFIPCRTCSVDVCACIAR